MQKHRNLGVSYLQKNKFQMRLECCMDLDERSRESLGGVGRQYPVHSAHKVTDAVAMVDLTRAAKRTSLGDGVEVLAVDAVNFDDGVDERCSRVAGAADAEVVAVPVEGDEDDAGRDKELSA
jgi:hypothetical protein